MSAQSRQIGQRREMSSGCTVLWQTMLQESPTHQIWSLTNLLPFENLLDRGYLLDKRTDKASLLWTSNLLQFDYLGNAHDEGLYQLKNIQQKKHQPPWGLKIAKFWTVRDVGQMALGSSWLGMDKNGFNFRYIIHCCQKVGRGSKLWHRPGTHWASHLVACVRFMHKHRFSTRNIYIYWLQRIKHSKKLITY